MKLRTILAFSITIISVAGCKDKKSSEQEYLEVSGKILNNPSRKIYLEEIPMTTMQRNVVDSAEITTDGKYKLKAKAGEAMVYNLRLDQNDYPLAAVINDASPITVNASFNQNNSQFAESYEVKGSVASQAMKDFMVAFNSKLQTIFSNARMVDSLTKAGKADSLVAQLRVNTTLAAQEARTVAMDALEKSNNPALSMFLLGYYQSTANNPGYRLIALEKPEVVMIIDKIATRFPEHKGVAAIKGTLQGWVGKPAPDFTMPDPNGKQVSLSSFRGKYVLVDFWASWCRPCRNENPNVVKAYNKFKDKNFTILGVSLDHPDGKNAWMKAVMDDHLTWTHVSDLMYWSSPVVNLYKFGEQGIPYNVLIDPKGVIIADGLRGEALEAKLAEVLK